MLNDLIAAKTLAGQLAGARAAGDRAAVELLADRLALQELRLTRDEREQLHRDLSLGAIKPSSFAATTPKNSARKGFPTKRRGFDEREEN